MKHIVLAMAMALSLVHATYTYACPTETNHVLMCRYQYMTETLNEVRVWSVMEDVDTGDLHSFWQYVATNQYKVGVTYNMVTDEKGDIIDVYETEY